MSDDPEVNVISPDECAVVVGPTGGVRVLVRQGDMSDEQGTQLLRLAVSLSSKEVVDHIDQVLEARLGALEDPGKASMTDLVPEMSES